MTPTTKMPKAMTQQACPSAQSEAALADPDSGLTDAYLNQFDEMVRLIEQLPETPELIGDLLNWRPRSYQDYFNASAMPGRVSAADVYASLNRCVRQNFEGIVDDLDRKALGAVAAIRRHYKTHGEGRPDLMMEICARAGTHLREVLSKAHDLVGHIPGAAGNFTQRRKLRVTQA
jgi:hypothetical protein